MSDIAASERRLSAALDRIDYLLDKAPAGGPAQSTAATASPDDSPETSAALAAAQARLDEIGQQAARLAAANEDLMDANRALIAARQDQIDPTEPTITALETEIQALRAARAAEIAQMGDIMAELERLLAHDAAATRPAAPAPFAADLPAEGGNATADILPFDDAEADNQQADAPFGAVYGDDNDEQGEDR